MSARVCAANSERTPPAQYRITGALGSGAAASICCSMYDFDTCRAPGMWPCSHSDASRTSTTVAAPAGNASTSCGVTSLIWARASRRRSAYDFDMVGKLRWSTGWRQSGARAVEMPRIGAAAGRRAGVRPAADTCIDPRAGSCARLRGSRRSEVGQDVLQAVVAEHRALETGRADLDAEQVEDVVGADGRHIAEWLALDLVG